MAIQLPSFLAQIKKERKFIKQKIEQEGYQRIISDCKFGVCDKQIPSFLINHQLKFLAPGRILFIELITESLNKRLRYFNKFIIPDYEENSLTGDLSHKLKLFRKKQLRHYLFGNGFEGF